MARKNVVKQLTELTTGLARLAFIAVAGALLFVSALLVGDLLLHTLSRITECLFGLVQTILGAVAVHVPLSIDEAL